MQRRTQASGWCTRVVYSRGHSGELMHVPSDEYARGLAQGVSGSSIFMVDDLFASLYSRLGSSHTTCLHPGTRSAAVVA